MVGFDLSNGNGAARTQLVTLYAKVRARYVHAFKKLVVDFHKVIAVTTVTVW
jgi:hypothetical protein